MLQIIFIYNYIYLYILFSQNPQLSPDMLELLDETGIDLISSNSTPTPGPSTPWPEINDEIIDLPRGHQSASTVDNQVAGPSAAASQSPIPLRLSAAPSQSPIPSSCSGTVCRPVQKPQVMSKKRKEPPEAEKLIQMAINQLSSVPLENEYTSIGKVVSFKLEKMEAKQAILAENLINRALFLGSLGKLDLDTKIVNGNSN